MDLKKIITISGDPDLFKLITNTHKGIIVESITTKKRQQAFASQRVNSLEDIAVYTDNDEIKLAEVFVKMYKYLDGKQALDPKKQAGEIKQFFEDFFPEYDRDRVKFSAMKKIIKWYNLLNEYNLIDDKIEEKTDEAEETDKNAETDEKKETENNEK